MLKPLIDAHCHLDSPRFDADRASVVEAARRAGVRGWLVAGVHPDDWDGLLHLSRSTPGMRAALGIHPWVAARLDPGRVSKALARLGTVEVAALGEMGLDRSAKVPKESMPRQISVFIAQLRIAREINKPIVLHVVGAHGRTLELLEREGVPDAGGMVHSYSGSAELVERYERLGLHLSLSGAVTRGGARRILRAAAAISSDRLLIETDCPDQSPTGRSRQRNEPAWLADVASAVAHARGETRDAVVEQTSRNAEALFGAFV